MTNKAHGALFVVSGPVLVFGITASVIYGVIYWITTLF